MLRDEIVNPLRKRLFVRADKVMALRTLLDTLSSVSGLTDQEKDPEEFLNSLFSQVSHVIFLGIIHILPGKYSYVLMRSGERGGDLNCQNKKRKKNHGSRNNPEKYDFFFSFPNMGILTIYTLVFQETIHFPFNLRFSVSFSLLFLFIFACIPRKSFGEWVNIYRVG